MKKNIAIIFAGGVGRRMNSISKPKQFLELNGKPIIIYTLEKFERNQLIDSIVISCVEDWIPYLQKIIQQFNISKVAAVVPGGASGQDSIYNGLAKTKELFNEDVCVLIHDGVRPLINNQTITDCINTVWEKGNCITCIPTTETFIVTQENGSLEIPPRKDSLIARAPQCFLLQDILAAHEHARTEGLHDFIDSCTLMSHYGYTLNTIMGPIENIKITTPADFYIFKAIVEAQENQQIFGL